MAVIRGIAFNFHQGTDRCRAVELAMDDDDYANVQTATIVTECDRYPSFVWNGSGLCVFHRSQLKVERGYALN